MARIPLFLTFQSTKKSQPFPDPRPSPGTAPRRPLRPRPTRGTPGASSQAGHAPAFSSLLAIGGRLGDAEQRAVRGSPGGHTALTGRTQSRSVRAAPLGKGNLSGLSVGRTAEGHGISFPGHSAGQRALGEQEGGFHDLRRRFPTSAILCLREGSRGEASRPSPSRPRRRHGNGGGRGEGGARAAPIGWRRGADGFRRARATGRAAGRARGPAAASCGDGAAVGYTVGRRRRRRRRRRDGHAGEEGGGVRQRHRGESRRRREGEGRFPRAGFLPARPVCPPRPVRPSGGACATARRPGMNGPRAARWRRCDGRVLPARGSLPPSCPCAHTAGICRPLGSRKWQR